MYRASAASPVHSFVSGRNLRISPLCCNFLYPKQFLGLLGWTQLVIGLYLFYLCADINVLKHTSIPGIIRYPFVEPESVPGKGTRGEFSKEKMNEELDSLHQTRMFLFAFSWIFVIGGFMTFMSFNWPRVSYLRCYRLSRIIPLFLLCPAVFNVLVCFYPLFGICVRLCLNYLNGQCDSLAAATCSVAELTIGLIAFIGFPTILLVSICIFILHTLGCGFKYLWRRGYRQRRTHTVAKVSKSWCHSAANSKPPTVNTILSNPQTLPSAAKHPNAAIEQSRYCTVPTQFIGPTYKEMKEFNEMMSEYGPFRSTYRAAESPLPPSENGSILSNCDRYSYRIRHADTSRQTPSTSVNWNCPYPYCNTLVQPYADEYKYESGLI